MTDFVDNAPHVFAAVCTLAVFACIVFPLRVYVRLSKKGAWGYDDWCMVVGFVPFAGLTIACLAGSFHGIGVHKERLNDNERSDGMMWFFLFEIFFCIAIIFIKLSISFMLARIAGPFRGYVHMLWVASGLVTVMNLIALFYIVLQCSPVSYAWDQSGPGSCRPSQDLAAIYYADTAVNIAVDWFCAFLPIPLLWNIEMNRNAKISVAVLLSLGVLASLSACIRLKYTVNLNNSDDFLYAIGDVVIWGYAENGIGLIVGCISTLRPLFTRVFGGSEGSRKPRGSSARLPDRMQDFEMGCRDKMGKGGNTIMKSVQVRQDSGRLASDSEEELVGERRRGLRV